MAVNLSLLSNAAGLVSFRPAQALTDAFYAGRTERTIRAYQQDLEDFRVFLGAQSTEEAAQALIGSDHGAANGVALAYKAHLIERGLQPATVNRRLAALRSIVKLARTLGLVAWTLEVEGMKLQAYRDTRGPGREAVSRMIGTASKRQDPKGARDSAIVRLMADMALRRGEVTGLDISDVDLQAGTVAILGKARTQKEALTLPEPTRAAISAWITARGTEEGPLFINFDRAGKGKRLTGFSVARIVERLAERAGTTARPHGLRHTAITEALDAFKGDIRAVQRFSRHRDLRTLSVYDDNRRDMGGEVAKVVAEGYTHE